MPERISVSECEHIATLANLQFTNDELARFTEQLGDILDHVNDMSSLDLDAVEPTAHPYPLNNVLRHDVAVPSLDRDEVLTSAPSVEANMFRVPPVMGEGA